MAMYTREALQESFLKVTFLVPKSKVTADMRIVGEIEPNVHQRVSWEDFIWNFTGHLKPDERVRIVGSLEKRGVAMGWYGGAWMVVEVLDEESD